MHLIKITGPNVSLAMIGRWDLKMSLELPRDINRNHVTTFPRYTQRIDPVQMPMFKVELY